MMTLLTAFHPAHAFWIGLLIVLAIIALMNLICWLLPPKKRPSKHPTLDFYLASSLGFSLFNGFINSGHVHLLS